MEIVSNRRGGTAASILVTIAKKLARLGVKSEFGPSMSCCKILKSSFNE